MQKQGGRGFSGWPEYITLCFYKVQKMIKMKQIIKSYFEKIFVITHNPMVSQWSDSIVKIEKNKNVSKVIQ